VVGFSINSDLTAYAADPHVEFDLDENGDDSAAPERRARSKRPLTTANAESAPIGAGSR
jgi:hypothetical protein